MPWWHVTSFSGAETTWFCPCLREDLRITYTKIWSLSPSVAPSLPGLPLSISGHSSILKFLLLISQTAFISLKLSAWVPASLEGRALSRRAYKGRFPPVRFPSFKSKIPSSFGLFLFVLQCLKILVFIFCSKFILLSTGVSQLEHTSLWLESYLLPLFFRKLTISRRPSKDLSVSKGSCPFLSPKLIQLHFVVEWVFVLFGSSASKFPSYVWGILCPTSLGVSQRLPPSMEITNANKAVSQGPCLQT